MIFEYQNTNKKYLKVEILYGFHIIVIGKIAIFAA